MADKKDKKISEFELESTLAGDELVPIVKDGVNYKTTLGDVRSGLVEVDDLDAIDAQYVDNQFVDWGGAEMSRSLIAKRTAQENELRCYIRSLKNNFVFGGPGIGYLGVLRPDVVKFNFSSINGIKLQWQYYKTTKHVRSDYAKEYTEDKYNGWHNFGTKKNPASEYLTGRASLFRVRFVYGKNDYGNWIKVWINHKRKKVWVLP